MAENIPYCYQPPELDIHVFCDTHLTSEHSYFTTLRLAFNFSGSDSRKSGETSKDVSYSPTKMESLRAKMKTTQHLKVRETRLQSKNRAKLNMTKQTIILKDTTQFGDSTAVATTLETVKVFLKQFTVRPR